MGERVEKEGELVKERCQVSKSSCTRVAGFGGRAAGPTASARCAQGRIAPPPRPWRPPPSRGDQTCASSGGCGDAAGQGCPGASSSPIRPTHLSVTWPVARPAHRAGESTQRFSPSSSALEWPLGTQQPGNGFLGSSGILSLRSETGRSSAQTAQGADAPRLRSCPQGVTLSGLFPVWTPDFLWERQTKKEKDFAPGEPGEEEEDISIAAQGDQASFSSTRLMAQLLGETANVFLSANKLEPC